LAQVVTARGHYLLVASAASFTVAPGLAAYCAAKAGVEAFGDALRLEVAHQGVTVGTAHPIWIDTDLVRDAKSDLPIFRASLEATPGPLGRQVDLATCARLIVEGIERRRPKVFVPPSLGWAFHARSLLTTPLARRVMQRAAGRSVPALEEQVRRVGRPFGEHSVETTRMRKSL
jgi:short-subunit dehydrogenase